VSAALLSLPVGLGMAGIGNLTSPALVARWFTAQRGRALAITMMGMSVATIVAAPPVAWLIDHLGWRQSLIVLGTIVTVFIALLLPWVRDAPGPNDHETPGGRDAAATAPQAQAVGPSLGPRQLLSNPRFWALGLSTALAMALFQGLLVSLIPIGREAGFSTTKAASLISAMGIAAITTKLVLAWLADRLDRALALACVYAMLGLASAEMLFAHSYPTLVLAAVLLGIAAGATMPLAMALIADRFGAKSFGSASGLLTFTISVISAVAVRFAGEVYDRTGGYDLLFYSFIAVGLLAAGLMLTVRGGATLSSLVPAE
jgi:cyanate permease